jgi:hypothetical protein
MWHNNKSVSRVHCKNGAQMSWAIISGISGWKRIKPNAADGVANIHIILTAAQANGRKVDVYIDSSNQITQATLR